METTNGPTSNGNKHHREDRICFILGSEAIPHFRQIRILHIKHHQDTHRHKEQGNGKERINLTDNLVHRHQGCQYIIQEDNDNPEISIHPFRSHTGNKFRRSTYEHGTYKNHQNHSENGHHLLGPHPQITTNQFRQTFTSMANRQSAREEIVYRSGKDRSQDNPQIRGRTELRPHNGTENRAETGNVQELNHKDFPSR